MLGARADEKRADNQCRAIPLTRNDAALSPYGPCERLRTRCGLCPKLAAWKRTRLLRRVPVKSVCVASICSAYGAGENRSPFDYRKNLTKLPAGADSEIEDGAVRRLIRVAQPGSCHLLVQVARLATGL
jgi:hypothetical protein